MSQAETSFDAMVWREGWVSHQAGWPDRWIEKDGEIVFVEIKAKYGELKSHQIETLQMLEAAGLKVRVWCGGGLDDMVTVEAYLKGEAAPAFKPLSPQAIYNYRSEIKRLEAYAATLPDSLKKEQVLELVKRRNAMINQGSTTQIGEKLVDSVLNPERAKWIPGTVEYEERLKRAAEKAHGTVKYEGKLQDDFAQANLSEQVLSELREAAAPKSTTIDVEIMKLAIEQCAGSKGDPRYTFIVLDKAKEIREERRKKLEEWLKSQTQAG